MSLLPIIDLETLLARRKTAIPPEVLTRAAEIVGDVRRRGEIALKEYRRMFDGQTSTPLYISRAELERAFESRGSEERTRLTRISDRIRRFAEAQLRSLRPLEMTVPGGRIGHRIDPMSSAGCYAPAGRYPLPSSVLMTALTARVAGVPTVWVACPRPAPIILAATALSEADGLLCAGGAHAIAALAYGSGPIPPCDIVAGPGNVWVTAAKAAIRGDVAIDALAGPSELVVVADELSDSSFAAADLLAQAEHDPLAIPVLVAPDEHFVQRVRIELERRIATLRTADVARSSLEKAGALIAVSRDEVVQVCDRIAPEHLQLSVSDSKALLQRMNHYGAAFTGEFAAEVFGDYGLGPNHVLPTGGTSRHTGGLTVYDFLRVRTWIEFTGQPEEELIADTAWLARQEGLEAHARAAELRLTRGVA